MSLQVFWQSDTPIEFPQYRRDSVNNGAYGQLRSLYFSTPAGMPIGLFEVLDSDWEINIGAGATYQYYGLFRLWRDGTRLEWVNDPQMPPFVALGLSNPRVNPTDNGTIAWAPDSRIGGLASPGDCMIVSAVGTHNYYRVNDAYPMDIYTGEVIANRQLLSTQDVGILRPTRGIAYSLQRITTSGTYTKIIENPSGAVRFSSVASVSYQRPRQLLFIDNKTVAAIFANNTAGSLDNNKPALIRVFDITTSAWTLRFEDVLPGVAHVACWDPINHILYATSRYASNAILYSCRIKRAPVTVAVPTLVVGTELGAMQATTIRTIITDSQGSAISNYVVGWLISGNMASNGAIVSGFSRTNNSGVATTVYVGPRNPPFGLQETITAQVSDVEG
ncbi:MAG TPA: Ig-like domain-containing protein [Alphaproteobacteria bacterium]|nr:Ig-like domain-containing protein [Alphaproteobacteria bacterium]